MFHIIVTHYLIILFYHYMRVSHKRDVILDFCLVIFMTWHEAWESVLKNYQDLSRSILFVYVSDVRFFDTIFFNTRSPKFLYFILKFRQNILLLLYLSIIHHLTKHHYHNFNKNKPWEKKTLHRHTIKGNIFHFITQKSFARVCIYFLFKDTVTLEYVWICVAYM